MIMAKIKNKLIDLRNQAVSALEDEKESKVGKQCFADVEAGLKVMTH